MTPSLNSAQSIQEEGESNLAKFTNTEDVMYSLLCSLSVRGRVGLVCETVIHPENPKSSPRSGKHPPFLSVLEQFMKGVITLEAAVVCREKLISVFIQLMF